MSHEAPEKLHRHRHTMTLSKLRHDIRNHLNAIKLSCALLHRQAKDQSLQESVHEVDRAADAINDLITRYMGDLDAPGLIANQEAARAAEAKTGT